MVVFQDAMAKKAHYRKFGIKGARRAGRLRGDGGGDLAPVRADAATARDEEYDESFAATPNLVVIDGGKGQLSAVLAAMQAFDLPRVAVISLAKRDEEVFVPGRPEPIVLDRALAGPSAPAADPRRGAPLRARLPPAAARREGEGVDLRHARRASGRRVAARCCSTSARPSGSSPRRQEELEGVPGVPAKTARSIYAQLHKAGRA